MNSAAKMKPIKHRIPFSVVVSGLTFAVFSSIVFHLASWKYDEWLILPLAVAHFLVAQRAQLVMRPTVVLFHYGVLLITLAGFWGSLTIRMPIGGGSAEQALALVLKEWVSPENLLYALVFLGSALVIFLGIYSLGLRLLCLHRSGSSWECSLFIYSILLIPSDFIVADIVAKMGAERPLEVADMISYALASSLVLPIVFHVLVVLILVYRRFSGRFHVEG